jgi:hypothetical protein
VVAPHSPLPGAYHSTYKATDGARAGITLCRGSKLPPRSHHQGLRLGWVTSGLDTEMLGKLEVMTRKPQSP